MRISPNQFFASVSLLGMVSCAQWDAPTGFVPDAAETPSPRISAPDSIRARLKKNDSLAAAAAAKAADDIKAIEAAAAKLTVTPAVNTVAPVPGPAVQPVPSDSSALIAPASPPGGTVFMATDFEDQSSSCWNDRAAGTINRAGCGVFSSIGPDAFSLSEDGIAHSGTKAIRIVYTKNEDLGGTNVAINSDSVNVRSYYYFGPGFDFGQGMKIGRVSSFNSARQTNDVDMVLECRSAGSANQCGQTDMRDLGVFFNGAPKGSDWGNVAANISFERGRWYAVEYQVVLNSPGKSDGAVRLWVDGVKIAERANLLIRGSLGAGTKLNTVKIGGWYSNGANGNTCANPSAPSKLYMDDVVIANSYVGTGPAIAAN